MKLSSTLEVNVTITGLDADDYEQGEEDRLSWYRRERHNIDFQCVGFDTDVLAVFEVSEVNHPPLEPEWKVCLLCPLQTDELHPSGRIASKRGADPGVTAACRYHWR